jgi:hypothetical protein
MDTSAPAWWTIVRLESRLFRKDAPNGSGINRGAKKLAAFETKLHRTCGKRRRLGVEDINDLTFKHGSQISRKIALYAYHPGRP